MSKTKIMIEVGAPSPGCQPHGPAPLSVEDKVRHTLDLIESGYCNHTEWVMLSKLYRALQQKKPTARIQNLKAMIEPVLAKYGYHGVVED